MKTKVLLFSPWFASGAVFATKPGTEKGPKIFPKWASPMLINRDDDGDGDGDCDPDDDLS